ncbi:MAG: phosphonate dehydrogenase [Pseudomonadota bacterium]
MQSKTVITQWVHPEIIDFLSPVTTVIANTTKEVWPLSKIIDLTQDADAIMVFMPDTIDVSFLSQCPNLKIVSAALKGYDNFDVDACTSHGVWFSIVPDLLTIPTAELAIGLMITMARNIPQGNALVKSGQFHGWRPWLYGKGLDDSIVGIIGMGQVGRAIAKRLSGYETRILCTDTDPILRQGLESLDLEQVDLDTLLSLSDFIVLATPYVDSTHYLINKDRLDRIKPDTFLINIGRGSCVEESAIAHALDQNRLAGYAADVFEFEDWARQDRPHNIHPELLASDSTVLTPHIGSAVDRVRFEIAMEAARNIRQVLEGESPKGAINQPARS